MLPQVSHEFDEDTIDALSNGDIEVETASVSTLDHSPGLGTVGKLIDKTGQAVERLYSKPSPRYVMSAVRRDYSLKPSTALYRS